MKVLVPIKRVIDPYVKIQVKADKSGVETQNVKMSMNPFDEIAIEESIRWLEAGYIDDIVAVSIGPSVTQDVLRKALAFGATKAILIETNDNLEPLGIAKLLKAVFDKESADCVLMGKQAIDTDYNQTGQMLAAMLNCPQATFASQINWCDDKKSLKVTREVDGGLETLELHCPCVITADLRLNEPRHLGLPNIMKAKKKPLEIIPISDFQVDTKLRLTTLAVEPPKTRQAGIMVETVDELISNLRMKEKVI